MEQENIKGVVLFGASSTVAEALADCFAGDGYDVVLCTRQQEAGQRLATDLAVRHQINAHVLNFDAVDYDSHEEVVAEAQALLGGIPEGIVLCFGYMAEQADCEADFSLAQQTIDTNLTGTISICERYAELFSARRSGWIAGLSSVAGDRGRKKNYIYGASKAGMSCYLQGLRNRLHGRDVHVVTIKPGFMDTKMTYGMDLPKALTASPEQAAKAMFKAIQYKQNEAYVLWPWRFIMMIIKAIPEWQFKKMDI